MVIKRPLLVAALFIVVVLLHAWVTPRAAMLHLDWLESNPPYDSRILLSCLSVIVIVLAWPAPILRLCPLVEALARNNYWMFQVIASVIWTLMMMVAVFAIRRLRTVKWTPQG